MKELYTKVINGDYQPLPSHYSFDLRNLITEILKVNPDRRPTCGLFPYFQIIIL